MGREFKKIVQERSINALLSVDGRKKTLDECIDEQSGRKFVALSTNLSNVDLVINDIDKLMIQDDNGPFRFKSGITALTWMLLDILLMHWTDGRQSQTKVQVPLNEYLEMRGVSYNGDVKRQILNDLAIINSIRYTYIGKNDGFYLCIGGGFGRITNHVIVFDFSSEFCKIMRQCKTLDYNLKALKFNQKKNPHSYYFQRYFDINYRRNSTKNPGSEKRMAISTVLEYLPEMPTLDVVGRKTKQLIIDPFFRDLEALKLDYELQTKHHKKINCDGIKFSDFISAYLVITDYYEYPSREKCAEAYQQHQEDRKEARLNKKKGKRRRKINENRAVLTT